MVSMWVQLKRCVLRMRVLQRGHSGDGCDFVVTVRGTIEMFVV